MIPSINRKEIIQDFSKNPVYTTKKSGGNHHEKTCNPHYKLTNNLFIV